MPKPYFLLFCSLVFSSCKTEYKKCSLKTNDVYLAAYNDILNEIIVRGTFNRYLGENEERVFKMYREVYENGSECSNKMKKVDDEVIRLHNKMFGDTSQFCSIRLANKLKFSLSSLNYNGADTNKLILRLRNLIAEFPVDKQPIFNALCSPQVKYGASDFKCCIAKIIDYKDLGNSTSKCYIGSISFSSLVLNREKNRGLLYYEFRCGGLCGYGCLISIKKVGSFWTIYQSADTWVS